MRKKISQREARRDKKRLKELEDFYEQINRIYSQDVVGGVNIATISLDAGAASPVAVRTARRLGHCVVVLGNETGELRFMAVGSIRKK